MVGVFFKKVCEVEGVVWYYCVEVVFVLVV